MVQSQNKKREDENPSSRLLKLWCYVLIAILRVHTFAAEFPAEQAQTRQHQQVGRRFRYCGNLNGQTIQLEGIVIATRTDIKHGVGQITAYRCKVERCGSIAETGYDGLIGKSRCGTHEQGKIVHVAGAASFAIPIFKCC